MGKRIILTGATGYVGEGVLLECLAHPAIDEVLVLSRKSCGRQHARLKELLVTDLSMVQGSALAGYDACFYCVGISVVGQSEEDYTRITYDTTITFARAVHDASPDVQFNFISGGGTDSTEKGRAMWARVKGRTENELARMGFKGQYNFRPGLMKATPGQRNRRMVQRVLVPLLSVFLPGYTCRMQEVGQAMINSLLIGYPKTILEVKDIKALAKGTVA